MRDVSSSWLFVYSNGRSTSSGWRDVDEVAIEAWERMIDGGVRFRYLQPYEACGMRAVLDHRANCKLVDINGRFELVPNAIDR